MTVPLFSVFIVLVAATAFSHGWSFFARNRAEWLIDGAGLLVQGIAVPLLQMFGIVTLLAVIAPQWRGSLRLSFVAAFLLNFVVVDYAYYWNHRLLHGSLWRWHAVHHTAPRLDVLVTARNTLWSPLLIIYVWVNALLLFLLHDPAGFVLGIALTAALDLWRHSPLTVPRFFSVALITPRDHAWHHSRTRTDVNFGANFSVWDRLHGTFAHANEAPDQLGIEAPWSLTRQFLFPFREGR